MNQWKNREEVIDWFKSINEKQLWRFVIFDIKDFYPSIKESLLKQSLHFAEKFIKVCSEKNPLSNMQESICFSISNTPGTKRKVDYLMMLKLVNLLEFLYFINSHANTTKNSTGLYRNDGVAVLKNISVPQAEKIKKHFKSILRKNNLNMIMK